MKGRHINCPDCQTEKYKIDRSYINKFEVLCGKANSSPSLGPTSFEMCIAWRHLCIQMSQDVRLRSSKQKQEAYIEDPSGILKCGGRLTYPATEVDDTEYSSYEFSSFVAPVGLVDNEVVIALAVYLHWEILPHTGVEQLLNYMLRIVHVEKLRTLIKSIRNSCIRCRILLKKRYLGETGNQSKTCLVRAPPFYSVQIDVCGPFPAHDSIKKRVKGKAYMLCLVCMLTSALNIVCLEGLSTDMIITSLVRHMGKHGYSKLIFCDSQASLLSLKSAEITVSDLQNQLWRKERIVLEVSTPHSHQERGKIENRIGVVRNMLEKSKELSTKKSYLEWESVGVCIANALNNIPIARSGDDSSDSPLSFISPNHLLLGRNNQRSMELPVVVEGSTLSRLEDVQNTVDTMLDYIVNDIHKFVPGKRLTQGEIPKPGEIVLFIMEESNRKRYEKFKYGRKLCSR